MNYWLLLIPIMSAILGWLCTWVAGKVFINKIIPARRESLAKTIGKAVSGAFSFSDLENKITDPDIIKKIMPVVEEHVDDFLRNKLKEKMPVVSMFIGNKTIDSLKEVFLKEIEDLFPHVLKQFTANLQVELNIEAMVSNKITNVSVAQLHAGLSPALRYFHIWGSITGFVIGVINLLIFLIINYQMPN